MNDYITKQLIEVVKANMEKGLYKPFRKSESEIIRQYWMQQLYLPVEKTDATLLTEAGTLIATGYERIVIGDYGAYIEISPEQIVKENIRIKKGQEYRTYDNDYSKHVKYYWYTANDDSDVKIYYQIKTVPYADYKVGMYYVDPEQVVAPLVEALVSI